MYSKFGGFMLNFDFGRAVGGGGNSLNPANRNGFTLAEVLVTLGIIGVVSAMTVPTLMQNYQRKSYVTQLHKVYNEIIQASERYVSDNNYVDFGESRLKGNSTELRRFINTYFKVVKDCGTRYTGCMADEYVSLSGGTVNTQHGQCNSVVVLASGASLCADTVAMADADSEDPDDENKIVSSNHAGSGGEVITFEVDINGKQGPNVYGRDYFSFQIDKNCNIFDKFYIQNGNKPDMNANNPDNGLFGKIIEDAWEMTY